VLCCRERHSNDVFHKIQRWNGRFYQMGCLWQVGVKIYVGHNGKPCPNARHVSSNLPGFQNLGSAVRKAEQEAEELQSFADKAAAETENTEQLPDTNEDPSTQTPFMEGVSGGDEDWEDEAEDTPRKGSIPRLYPRHPPRDGSGNDFLTVVHTNGFHHIPVVWCACEKHQEDRDLQLLDLQLLPASYINIKTVFTFACLEDHRLENLECKTSHYQYHGKLRRLTCPKYPMLSPNRYAELCRVSRQWRNMKYRKWFWLLGEDKPERGSMALFCAACPQPDINLPTDWKADMAKNPWVFNGLTMVFPNHCRQNNLHAKSRRRW